MVLTVTANAAVDLVYELDRVRLGEPNRVRRVHAQAGGKGINVARVLAQLGCRSFVLGLAGGPTGQAIEDELQAAGLEHELVKIANDSRRSVTIVDRGEGTDTAFNEPGAPISQDEWRRLRTAYASRLDRSRLVVIAGSLPPGAPTGAYADLVAAARERGLPVYLDAQGEELLAGLAARPTLAAPNLEEASAAGLGTSAAQAVRELRHRGAEAAVVSLGREGVMASAPEGEWRAVPPPLSGNSVGAGDALLAALVAGELEQVPWPQRLRRAAAVGAAAVLAIQAGRLEPADAQRIEPAVRLERLDAR